MRLTAADAEHERMVAAFLAASEAADPGAYAAVEAKYVVLDTDHVSGRIREEGHRVEVSAFGPTDEAEAVPHGKLSPSERQSMSVTHFVAENVQRPPGYPAGVPDVYLSDEALRRRESRKPPHEEMKQRGRKAPHKEKTQGSRPNSPPALGRTNFQASIERR